MNNPSEEITLHYMDLRMQEELRADIDQKLSQGWHIESRDPLTLSNRKSFRIKERTFWRAVWIALALNALAAGYLIGVLV